MRAWLKCAQCAIMWLYCSMWNLNYCKYTMWDAWGMLWDAWCIYIDELHKIYNAWVRCIVWESWCMDKMQTYVLREAWNVKTVSSCWAVVLILAKIKLLQIYDAMQLSWYRDDKD